MSGTPYMPKRTLTRVSRQSTRVRLPDIAATGPSTVPFTCSKTVCQLRSVGAKKAIVRKLTRESTISDEISTFSRKSL